MGLHELPRHVLEALVLLVLGCFDLQHRLPAGDASSFSSSLGLTTPFTVSRMCFIFPRRPPIRGGKIKPRRLRWLRPPPSWMLARWRHASCFMSMPSDGHRLPVHPQEALRVHWVLLNSRPPRQRDDRVCLPNAVITITLMGVRAPDRRNRLSTGANFDTSDAKSRRVSKAA